MKALLNGFNNQEATFFCEVEALPNRAVALQSSGYLSFPEEKAPFTGIVTYFNEGIASVAMQGYVKAVFNKTLPVVGICKLTTGSMGCLEVDEENGTPYTVVGVDYQNKTMEIIL